MSSLYEELAQAVADMDDGAAQRLALEIVDRGLPVAEAIEEGLVPGMEKAGQLFENEEYFITELLLCADAMDAAMKVFAPLIQSTDRPVKGKVVIGSIFGDTHDIGKNIVALMLSGAGFDVLNLGRDVPAPGAGRSGGAVRGRGGALWGGYYRHLHIDDHNHE